MTRHIRGRGPRRRDARRRQADRSARALATRRATLRGEVQRLTSVTGIEAAALGVAARTVRRWEAGLCLPQPHQVSC